MTSLNVKCHGKENFVQLARRSDHRTLEMETKEAKSKFCFSNSMQNDDFLVFEP
jgi:hypothetical protein